MRDFERKAGFWRIWSGNSLHVRGQEKEKHSKCWKKARGDQSKSEENEVVCG